MAFPASCANYFTVTFDHTLVTGDVTNAPVLITENHCPAGFWSHVGSGAVVVFLDDGTTQVPCDKYYLDTGGHHLKLWAKVPTYSHTTNTVLRVYYNTVDSQPAANSTYGSENVWDGNHKCVYDFGDGTTLSLLDSTGNSFDWENVGTAVAAAGLFGGAVQTTNGTKYLKITDSSAIASDWPLEVFVVFKPNSTSDVGELFWIKNNAQTKLPIWIQLGAPSSGYGAGHNYDSTVGDSSINMNGMSGSPTYSSSAWNFIWHSVGVSGSHQHALRFNDVESGDGSWNNLNTFANNTMEIGPDISLLVSHLRLSSVRRSVDWRNLEYQSFANNATYATGGAEQGIGGGGSAAKQHHFNNQRRYRSTY